MMHNTDPQRVAEFEPIAETRRDGFEDKQTSDHPVRVRVHEILDCARNGDRVSRFVDLSIILLIFLNMLAVVIESMESIRIAYQLAFTWFELFSVAVFSLEYLLRIWSCVENHGKSHPRYGNWKLRLKYIRSLPALIDLLAILPFYLFHCGLLSNVDMRFMRCFRLFRVFKLTRYSRSMTLLMIIFRDNARIFGITFYILLIVMLFAASGIYLFERVAQPDDFGSIPAAMWWAFATLTTVGYGDVTPITVGGKVFGALITVVSIGIVALPAGILASSFSEQLRLRKDQYRSIADQAFADGVLTNDEGLQLEELRVSLGLSENTAVRILDQEKGKMATQVRHRKLVCQHCGHPVEN